MSKRVVVNGKEVSPCIKIDVTRSDKERLTRRQVRELIRKKQKEKYGIK
jgi:hypothetical protein